MTDEGVRFTHNVIPTYVGISDAFDDQQSES